MSLCLVTINVNCQSATDMELLQHHVTDSIKPDMIIRMEAWLKPDIANSEVFPLENYQVIWKTKPTERGGLLIMARCEFKLERERRGAWNCILIWGRFSISASIAKKTLHIGAFCCREAKDEDSLDQLQPSLKKKTKKNTVTIILAGDFNLPGWN